MHWFGGRYETLSFVISQPHTIHGFAGTFDCQLYGSVGISTAPVHVSHSLLVCGVVIEPACEIHMLVRHMHHASMFTCVYTCMGRIIPRACFLGSLSSFRS